MEIYPPAVQSALSKMTDEQKITFQNSYDQLKKNKVLSCNTSEFFSNTFISIG